MTTPPTIHSACLARLSIRLCTAGAVALACLAPSTQADDWTPPRTPWGTPDLQGVWTNATITRLERPEELADQPVLTPEEALRIQRRNAEFLARASQRTEDREAPPKGGNIGGYNTFWMDPGDQFAVVDGEIRTSLVVDPADGRIPYKPEARDRFAELRRRVRTNHDHPEARPLGERCLVGFGSSGGPPMLPVLYNNHYQFVQSPDHVAIVVEMNHDARVVRMGDDAFPEHLPDHIRPWLGDSVGRWDGDTLVVETTNFHPGQSYRGATRHRLYVGADAKVTERFTHTGPDTIEYVFTVEDPESYTQPWRGEMPLHTVDDKMFEYACHEGNYALPGILAGARREERMAGGESE